MATNLVSCSLVGKWSASVVGMVLSVSGVGWSQEPAPLTFDSDAVSLQDNAPFVFELLPFEREYLDLPPARGRLDGLGAGEAEWRLVDASVFAVPADGFTRLELVPSPAGQTLLLTASPLYTGRIDASLDIVTSGNVGLKPEIVGQVNVVVWIDDAPLVVPPPPGGSEPLPSSDSEDRETRSSAPVTAPPPPLVRKAGAPASPVAPHGDPGLHPTVASLPVPGQPEDLVANVSIDRVTLQWSPPVGEYEIHSYSVSTAALGESTVFATTFIDTSPSLDSSGRLVYEVAAIASSGVRGPAAVIDAARVLPGPDASDLQPRAGPAGKTP